MLPSKPRYKMTLSGSLCMGQELRDKARYIHRTLTHPTSWPITFPPGVRSGTHHLSSWPQQGFSHPLTFLFFFVFFLFMFPLFLYLGLVFILYALFWALPVLFLHLASYGEHSPTLCITFHIYFNTLLCAQNRHIYRCVSEEKSYHLPSYSRLSQITVFPWNLTD